MESFHQTKEIYGANIFNTGTTFNSNIGGDGKALCARTIRSTAARSPTSPTVDGRPQRGDSLLNGMIAIRTNFRDQAGLKIFARARKLLVPPQLEPVAIRLTKTELRPAPRQRRERDPETAGGLPEGYMVMDFLTSPSRGSC
jgi:hypothetical protein